jgi:hypothetical protein
MFARQGVRSTRLHRVRGGNFGARRLSDINFEVQH